jgi:hypothetical protein
MELGPLRWGLPEGMIFRWYAANIPMNIVSNCGFEGEIDLIARLRFIRGATAEWIYKTWEIKVAVVDSYGQPRSMKGGKSASLLRQKFRLSRC